jgi:hypothetical protein
MLQYTDEERERFADFASLLLICRCLLRQVMEQTQMQPSDGSAADDDIRALRNRRTDMHPRVPLLIPITTETYLYAASEHIGALAALFAREEVLIGPLVLGRCAIEHCAHTLWILGAGGDEPVDGRVARALIDELSGAREARKQTEGLVGEDSDDYRHRQTTLEDFEAAAISMFGEPIRVKQRYRLGGQEFPGHRDLIVEASRVATIGLPDRVIRGTYALMSNSVHPTPHSIRELFHIEQHGNEATATLARPADFHENLTKMVVFYFYNALTYVMSYKGLDPAGHEALERAVRAFSDEQVRHEGVDRVSGAAPWRSACGRSGRGAGAGARGPPGCGRVPTSVLHGRTGRRAAHAALGGRRSRRPAAPRPSRPLRW